MLKTRSVRRALLVPAALMLTGLPAQAAKEIQPLPSVLIPEVRGKLPAQYSTLLGIAPAGDKLVVVGDYGNVLTSKDGEEWTHVQAPHNAMLNSLEMVDAKNGWAVGHDNTILRTTDGGETWKIQYFDADKSTPWYDTHFDDANTGFVVGASGKMMKTTDGGSSWVEIENFLVDLGMHANSVSRLNDGTLVVTGERSILLKSTDNGETFELITSPYAGTWFGVLPQGDKGAVFFGLRGNVYATDDVSAVATEDPDDWDEFEVETTTDAGELKASGWRKLNTAGDFTLFNGTVLDDGRIALVGTNGAAYVSDSDVSSLRKLNNPGGKSMNSVAAFRGKLYAVGVDGIHTLKP